MFGRIARVVGNLFTVVDDTKPSNRIRLACESLENRCTPATFTVNSPGDFDDQVPGDGKAGRWFWEARVQVFLTSLRSAVQEGNVLAVAGKDSNHSILFDMESIATSTIEIKNGPLQDLVADYTINGPGPSVLTITKPPAEGNYRLFTGGESKTVIIKNLGLTNGNPSDFGGAILGQGKLTVDGCYIAGNTAEAGGGAIAIASKTELWVKNSTICYNGASGDGGGIFASYAKTIEVTDSTIVSNGAENGGGVYCFGSTVLLNNVAVALNSATTAGGGIAVENGTFLMTGGEVTDNTAGGFGGGVYLDNPQESQSKMDQVSVTGNHSGTKGGGFYVMSGVLTFSNGKALSGNTATLGFDGGAYKPPPVANVILVAPLITFQGIGQDP